jgi:hypothetical protein
VIIFLRIFHSHKELYWSMVLYDTSGIVECPPAVKKKLRLDLNRPQLFI